MKIKIYLFSLLFAGIFSSILQAQVSDKVVKTFPPSVVVKVYDFVTKVPVSEAKQLDLAKFFQKEDSLVVAAIKSGASAESIRVIKLNQDLHSILSEEEVHAYSGSQSNADLLAKAEAKAINARVKGNEQTFNYLYKISYTKFMTLEDALKNRQRDSLLNNRLFAIALKYDTLQQGQIKTFVALNYIKERIQLLDSIKPVEKTEKEKLEKTFKNLCLRTKGEELSENFKKAMINEIRDTTYYSHMYSSEIRHRALFNSNRELIKYIKEYNLNPKSINQFKGILYEKEKRFAVLDAAFPFFTQEKDKMVFETKAYFDSIMNVSLYKDGIKTPDTWFFRAVRDKNYLSLNKQQVDSLESKGFALEKMLTAKKQGIKGYENLTTIQYEREQIPLILTEEQYNKFLIRENRATAKNYAIQNWNEIKQRGVAQTADSIQLYKAIENYELARAVAVDRYRHDKGRKTANIRAIEQNMPAVMRQLKAARKITTSADSTGTSAEKGYKGTFQW